MDFQNPTTHAGFDFFQFNGFADTAIVRVFATDDSTLLFTSALLPAPNAPAFTFFGFTDPGGIGLITIQSTSNSFSPLIDDLTYGVAAAAVPEPTSLALVGLGAIGFGYYHRRKQKKLKLKQAA